MACTQAVLYECGLNVMGMCTKGCRILVLCRWCDWRRTEGEVEAMGFRGAVGCESELDFDRSCDSTVLMEAIGPLGHWAWMW